MAKTVFAADLFCGAGGTSTGLIQACRAMGRRVELVAVNHWDVAVETHAKNHPWANHLCASLDNVDPRKAVPGGQLDLLVASPECTHHSIARGGKPCNDQSRASAWLVIRWISELQPKAVLIENVKDFVDWGPLDSQGKPARGQKGKTFRAWIQAIRSMGYRVDSGLLTAANYGDATTRQRIFVVASKGNKRPPWPRQTHSEKEFSIFQEGLDQWRQAREIIDWSIPGKSIFNRSKPLAEKTMARIRYGLEKFGGPAIEPFILPQQAGRPDQLRVRSMAQPMATIATKGAEALVEPFLVSCHGGGPEKQPERRVHSFNDPIPTLDCSNRFGVVKPFVIQYNGTSMAHSIQSPLGTVTTRDRFGIVQGAYLDITLRMLEPHELAAAMSFPRDYQFAGTKADQVRQIGNAVPVRTAQALCSAILTERSDA